MAARSKSSTVGYEDEPPPGRVLASLLPTLRQRVYLCQDFLAGDVVYNAQTAIGGGVSEDDHVAGRQPCDPKQVSECEVFR